MSIFQFKKNNPFRLSFRFWLLCVITLFISGIGIYFLMQTSSAKAAWFDDQFQYRIQVPITNSGSDLTNYPIAITLDTTTLISAGKMQSDCDDIRVVAENGQVLPHLLDIGGPACNTSTTNIWTKVPSIPTTGATVYVYYGNANATNIQNGGGVFDEWDLTTFTEVDPNSHLTVLSSRQIAATNMSSNENAYIYKQIASRTTGTINVDVLRTAGANKITCVGVSNQVNNCLDATSGAYMIWKWSGAFRGFDTTGNTLSTALNAMSDGTRYYLTIKYSGSNATFYTYSDPQRTTLISSQSFSYSTAFTHIYAISSYEDATVATINDHLTNFHVRPYVATEPVVGTFGSEEVSSGAIAYWKFDEGQGTKANDSSERGNTGTFASGSSAPTWASKDLCISGSCLRFDGTNDYINVGNKSDLSFGGTTPFTISMWIKSPTPSVSQTIFSKYNGGVAGHYYLTLSGGQIGFLREVSPWSISTPNIIEANKWYFITAVYDRTNISIYVNGDLRAGPQASGSISNISTNVLIGSRYISNQPAAFFNGFIDEAKVYPYARTAEQIKTDYIQGASGTGSGAVLGRQDQQYASEGLVGYWKMNESSWVGPNAVLDSSGNMNSGTAVGNATVTTGKFGNGGTFDGNGDYVSFPSNSLYEFAGASFSVSFWVKPGNTAGSNGRIVTVDDGSSTREWSFFYNSTNSEIHFYTNGSSNSSIGSITNGTWYHVVGVVDRASSKKYIYLNGVKQDEDTFTDFTDTSAQLRFGGFYNGSSQWLNGGLDEVRMYNRALNEREINQLYNQLPTPAVYYDFDDSSGPNERLIAYYRMDENRADACGEISVTDSCDSTENELHGTWNGTVTPTAGKYGAAIDLNGSDGFVNLPPSSNYMPTANSPITVSLWLNADTIASGDYANRAFTIAQSASGSGLILGFDNTNKAFLYNGTTRYEIGTVSTGQWYHIAVTYNGTVAQRYFNGDPVGAPLTITFPAGHSTTAKIGTTPSGTANFFDGKIDDVRVYNYPLSVSEMADVYNFDTLPDKSGNNVTGTLKGIYTNDWQPGKYGQALYMDGANNYVEVPDNSNIDLQDNFSVSFWMKPEGGFNKRSDGYMGILDKGSYNVFLDNSNGRLTVETNHGGTTWSGVYSNNTSLTNAIIAHDDKLYVGKGHATGAGGGDLFEFDGTTWTQTYNNTASWTLALGRYQGDLYYASGLDSGNVYIVSGTGVTDTSFNTCIPIAAQSFEPFNGLLYGGAGTSASLNSGGGDVCVYNGSSWSQAYDGVGSGEQRVYALQTYNGMLYKGNYGGNWGDVHEFNGTSWRQVFDAGTVTGDTFGMGVWNGNLWILNGGGSNQATHIKYDGITGSTVPNGIAHPAIFDMAAYNGKMFFGLGGSAGAGDVYTYDGSSFTSSYNGSLCYVRALAVWRGDLYGGIRDCNDSGPGGIVIKMEGGDYLASNKTSWTDEWHHVTLTKSGTSLKMYVNGALEGSTTLTGSTLPNNTNSLLIGSGYGSRGESTGDGTFKGAIDEVKIYHNVLTEEQIIKDMNKTELFSSPPYGIPRGYYKFDEGAGTTLYNSGSEGTAADGTNNGPTWTSSGKYGSALSYDGVNDQTTVNNILGLNKSTDMTVSLWVNLPDASESGSFVKIGSEASGDNDGFGVGVGASTFETEGNELIMLYEGVRWIDTNAVIGTGWHHIVATIDSSGVPSAYIDGRFIGSFSGTGMNAPEVTDTIKIGGYTSSTPSNRFGQYVIDEVKIYDYSFTANDALQDYNMGQSNVPYAHWKLDEGYGSVIHNSFDASTSTQGYIHGASWSNEGKFGKALNFDGTDDYVVVEDSNGLDSPNGFTVSLWANPNKFTGNTQPQGFMLNKGIFPNYNYRLITWGNSGARKFEVGANIGGTFRSLTTTNDFNTNEWHHVAGSYDGSNLKIYVNGILENNLAVGGTLNTNSTDLYIGKYSNSSSYEYKGLLDEIKTYSYALTQDEIRNDFNRGKAIVLGSSATTSTGSKSNSAGREYCIPGDSSTCNTPIAEYRFDENTGTSAHDTSGNNLNGTLGAGTSTPGWTTGVKGGALNFDGNDYVDAGTASVLAPTQLSVSMWIRPNSFPTGSNYSEPIRKEGSYHISIIGTGVGAPFGGTINLGIKPTTNANLYIPTSNLTLGKWNHVAMTANGSTLIGYINGLEVGSTGYSGNIPNTSANKVFIGAYGTTGSPSLNRGFNGMIDDVRIYNYARTPAQIVWEYSKGAPIAHYKFDECEGTTIYNSAPTYNDNAAGNNGTLTIGATGSNTTVGTCATSGAWADGATGKRGSSIDFDGTNDHVTVADNDIFDFAYNQDFSIALWVKAAVSQTNTNPDIVSKWGSSGGYPYSIRLNSTGQVSGIRYDLTNSPSAQSNMIITDNQWHHVVFTKRGSTLYIYIDGKLENTAADTTTGNTTNSHPLFFGRRGGNNVRNYAGLLDDVRIYNYGLTDQQVKVIYNNGAVSFE